MRDWIALYPSILDSEKWGELPDDTARVGWIVAMLLATRQPTEGTFESREKLARLFRKEGVAVEAIGPLIEQGCLDVQDTGEVAVRSWTVWQKRWRGPSDDPALKAALERERYWRDKAESLGASGTNLGESGIEEKRGEDREDKRGEETGVAPAREDPPDSLDRFYELTLLRPWGKDSGRWLREIEANYGGPEAVRAAMDAEYAVSAERQTLISRTEARLARAADKRRQSRKPPKAQTNGVDPEVASRQRAALEGMIRGKTEVRDD